MPLFLLRIQWWMEGAISAASRLYGFIPKQKLWPIERERPGISQAHGSLTGAVFWSLLILKTMGSEMFSNHGGKIIRPQPCHFYLGFCPKKWESKLGDLGNPGVFHGFPKIFRPSHPSTKTSLTNSPEVAQLPGGLQALWWKRRSKTECSRDVGLRFLVEWNIFRDHFGTGIYGMILEIARWV